MLSPPSAGREMVRMEKTGEPSLPLVDKSPRACYSSFMVTRRTPVGVRRFAKIAAEVFVLMAAATLLGGCITFLTEIKVRSDGSGTMVQTMTLNPEQMKEMMEGVAKQMGATTTESKEEPKEEASKQPEEGPFKESDLKNKAADLGNGVSFVSMEKIDTRTAAGVRVTYAFKDVNQLSVNPKPGAAMGTDSAGASSEDALKFHFRRKPDGNAVLTVTLPPSKPETPKEQDAAPPPQPSPMDPAQQMAMVRQMFKGLHMGLSVNVEGEIVKTNSPYVEGSRVTLMDIDFDPLLANAEDLKALSSKLEKTKGDDRKTMEALKGIKGLKITTDPEVSIEFKPKE
jgi:hypothetical protein